MGQHQSIRKIDRDTAAARRAFHKALSQIQERWEFQNQEMAQLIHIAPTTYGVWMRKQEVPVSSPPYKPETEAAISVAAIHRSLSAMFRNPHDQVLWLKSPHPSFRGEAPFQYAVASLSNLFQLRAYLDYVRGRGA